MEDENFCTHQVIRLTQSPLPIKMISDDRQMTSHPDVLLPEELGAQAWFECISHEK